MWNHPQGLRKADGRRCPARSQRLDHETRLSYSRGEYDQGKVPTRGRTQSTHVGARQRDQRRTHMGQTTGSPTGPGDSCDGLPGGGDAGRRAIQRSPWRRVATRPRRRRRHGIQRASGAPVRASNAGQSTGHPRRRVARHARANARGGGGHTPRTSHGAAGGARAG